MFFNISNRWSFICSNHTRSGTLVELLRLVQQKKDKRSAYININSKELEASTHKSVKTHAGTVFYLTFRIWPPKSMGFQNSLWHISMSSSVIGFWDAVQKNRQTVNKRSETGQSKENAGM